MASPYRWVPSTYIMQGLPFGFVILASPILYKTFGISNINISFYTSLFILPWMLKALLAPAIEGIASKKKFLIYAQICIGILILLLSYLLFKVHWFYVSLILFSLIAVLSAIYDL